MGSAISMSQENDGDERLWPIDYFCERCNLEDKRVPAMAQHWGNGDFRLTCSDKSCGWSRVSESDWSLGSGGPAIQNQ